MYSTVCAMFIFICTKHVRINKRWESIEKNAFSKYEKQKNCEADVRLFSDVCRTPRGEELRQDHRLSVAALSSLLSDFKCKFVFIN